MDFEAALDFAMNDLSCKEQYFITPTALLNSAARRTGSSNVQAAPAQHAKGKGNGSDSKDPYMSSKKRKLAARQLWLDNFKESNSNKGEGKGNKKGAGKKGGKSHLKKTPDGRLICQFYNRQNGCSKATCDFVHVCSNCFSEDHAATNCTSR
jgi:hypothetical protein